MVEEGALIAIPGDRGRRYPAFQFTSEGQIVDGLRSVLAALGQTDPFSALDFLCDANDDLAGERPIDVMTRGEVAAAVEAARHYNRRA